MGTIGSVIPRFLEPIMLKRELLRAGEVAQEVKFLPCKCEEPEVGALKSLLKAR
jgi:hypothetical protein